MQEKDGLDYQSVLKSVNSIDVSEYPSPDVFVQIGQSAQTLIDQIVSETNLDSSLDQLAYSVGPKPKADLRSVTRSQVPDLQIDYAYDPEYIKEPKIETNLEYKSWPEVYSLPESVFEEEPDDQADFDITQNSMPDIYSDPPVTEEYPSPPYSFDYMQTEKDQNYYRAPFMRTVEDPIPQDNAPVPKTEEAVPQDKVTVPKIEKAIPQDKAPVLKMEEAIPQEQGEAVHAQKNPVHRKEKDFSFRNIKFIIFLIILFLVEMLMLGFLINVDIIHF